MNPDITFETVLRILMTAHMASVMLLIAVAQIGLAAIATIEEATNQQK